MRSFLRAQSVILLDKLGFDDGTRRGEIRPVPGEIGFMGTGEIAPGGTVKLPPERR